MRSGPRVAVLLLLAACASTSGVQRMALAYSRDSVTGPHTFVAIVRKNDGFISGSHYVPDAHVAAIVRSLTNLHEADGLHSCGDHTDDYPVVRVVLETVHARVVLSSTSNCHAMAPWNVIMNSRLYVQYDGSIGRAVWRVLHDVDPKWNLTDYGRIADVDLAAIEPPPPGIQVTAPVGPLLEQIVMRDATYTRFFGTQRRIVESHFYCSAKDECHELTADIVVAWNDRIEVAFDAKIDTGNLVSIDLDDELKRTLALLIESPLARAMPFDRNYPTRVSRYSGICPVFSPTRSDKCRALEMRAGHDDKGWGPQHLRLDYFPDLDVVMVTASRPYAPEDGPDTTPEVIQSLIDFGNNRATIERAFARFQGHGAYFKLDGQLVRLVESSDFANRSPAATWLPQ